MARLILLDSGVVGIITNPKSKSIEAQQCKLWYASLLERGENIALPEIANYEVRRELIRADKNNGLKRLEELQSVLIYLPITTQTILLAAQFWAEVRKSGQATADPKSLDGDVILAAQAKIAELDGNEVVVATTNVKHLALFIDAREWQNIEF
jgi:predicted nucleic acid-binding protein